jgi:uncharacterized membrane protein (DUF485 family)
MDYLPHETILGIVANLDIDSTRALYFVSKYFNFLDKYEYTTMFSNQYVYCMRKMYVNPTISGEIYVTDDYFSIVSDNSIIMVDKRWRIAQVDGRVHKIDVDSTDVLTIANETQPKFNELIEAALDDINVNLILLKPYFDLSTLLTYNQSWFASPLHTAIAYRFGFLGYNDTLCKFMVSYGGRGPHKLLNYPIIKPLQERYNDVFELLVEHNIHNLV